MEKNVLSVSIGTNRNGVFKIDFQKIPHLLVCGLSGTGKTRYVESLLLEFMKQYFACLINVYQNW